MSCSLRQAKKVFTNHSVNTHMTFTVRVNQNTKKVITFTTSRVKTQDITKQESDDKNLTLVERENKENEPKPKSIQTSSTQNKGYKPNFRLMTYLYLISVYLKHIKTK